MTERTPRSPDMRVDALILDVPVTVEGLPPTLATRLKELLHPFLAGPDLDAATFQVRAEEDASPATWSVYAGDTRLAHFTDEHELLAHLEWRMAATALEASRERIPFHAAALARDGKVLLLIGESGAGKTTLTIGLTARGWIPYADDIAVIDTTTLSLRPFPRCFHVDEATRALTGPASLVEMSEALPGYGRPPAWAHKHLQPTTLVLVRRDAQRPSELGPVTQAEAAGALLQAAIRNQVPLPEVANVSVRIAAGLSACCRLNNAQFAASLDLLEGI